MEEERSRESRLLAMILVQLMAGADQKAKVVALSRSGLSNAEIATLLDSKPTVVAQQLYEARKKKPKKAASRKKA